MIPWWFTNNTWSPDTAPKPLRKVERDAREITHNGEPGIFPETAVAEVLAAYNFDTTKCAKQFEAQQRAERNPDDSSDGCANDLCISVGL